LNFVSKATVKAALNKLQGQAAVRASVASTALVTPHMRRIIFVGKSLEPFAKGGPAQWVKIPFPVRDGGRPVARAYTVRCWDPETSSLAIDFALHASSGPASAWAERAAVGDQVEIVGPRHGHSVRPEVAWRLLAGDETALSAIAAILEVLPQTDRPFVFIEVPTPEDRQSLTAPPSAEIRWLPRSEHKTQPGERFADAVCGMSLPPGDGQVFLAGEARAVRRIRDYASHSVGSVSIDAKGYWLFGTSCYRG